jgi:hypothetical protein
MDNKIKSALDAAGTAADYSARATFQRGYDAGVASADEFWKSRDIESQCAMVDARYEAKAAQQMVAELRDQIAIMARQEDAGLIAALLEASAPIAGRWCLASERDAAVARAEAAEAREWALGVQVVAQQERLRLAEDLAKASRNVLNEVLSAIADDAGHDEPWFVCPHGDLIDALAAWDTVPGDNKETT